MASENPYAAPIADTDVDESHLAELAGRGRRLGGALIDGFLLMLVVIPFVMLTGIWDRQMVTMDPTIMDAVYSGVFGMGIFLLINGYLLMKSGQTVGKRMLNMQIVAVSDNKILPIGKLVGLRYLPQWVVSQLPVVGGICGLVNVLFIFGKDRRCVHDYIAGTKVIMLHR